jgi:hypothetical protein
MRNPLPSIRKIAGQKKEEKKFDQFDRLKLKRPQIQIYLCIAHSRTGAEYDQ